MEFYLIRNIGAEVDATAGATAKIDFSAGTNYSANFRRQGVAIASCGAASLYLKIVGNSASAPTVTSANYLVQVQAGQTVMLRCTRDVAIYVFGTTAYVATELG